MQRHTSAVTLRGMFLLLCTSSVIAHARNSTNMTDEVLHTEDNHCQPILVNGELMPTEPEYMPSFPASLKGIKRNFVCKLSAPTTVSTTPPTTSRPTNFASTTSLEATTNPISDSTTPNPIATTKSTTTQDTTTMSTTEPTTSHAAKTTQSTAKIFVTGENGIFVADLQGDLDFIPIPSTNKPGYIAYDSVEKKIYWTDRTTRRVYRADVDGRNREEVTSGSSDELRGIAIAETSRTLYIAKKSPAKITSVLIVQGSSFDGAEMNFTSGLSGEPYSLEVDEGKGFLYWSMRYNILRKPLNGSGGTETVYNNDFLSEITGLSIDISRNPRRIFFCDFGEERSFYMDVNQPLTSLTTAHELTDYMNYDDIDSNEERVKLRDISYFNGTLYWTKEENHRGVAVMTNYDQGSPSFDIKEANEIYKPYQLLITNVDP